VPGPGDRLRALAGASLPPPLRQLDRELRDRIRKLPLPINEYGFDRFGFHADTARRMWLPAAALYRYWFRVETHGIQQVPPGRVLLIANHAGQFAYDGAMLGMSMLLAAEPPRVCRGMGEYFLWKVPWLGTTAARMGTMVGTPENCVAVLEDGGCVMAFPEGARGANKPFRKRYQLQRFGTGFMRLALETDTPIVPVGIVGSEEQQPGLANLERLGRAVGLPSLPITITMPWLGPLGATVALPVKYRMYFGEPMHFEGKSDDEDRVIRGKVNQVQEAISALIQRGLDEREEVFF